MKVYYAHRSNSKIYNSKKEYDSYLDERIGNAEEIVVFGVKRAKEFLSKNDIYNPGKQSKKFLKALIENDLLK